MAAAAAPPARTGAPGWTAAATVAPASIVVTIGIVLPIVILFRYSLNQYTPAKVMVDAFTLENYAKFFTDPFYLAVLFRTIRVAALCTAICVVLAFPMAYCLARTRSRFKNLLLMAVILPLFVGNAVRAAGWMVLFGNRGFVNSMLMGLGITREPLQIMYTEFAVVVGVIAVNLPFVVLTLQAVLEGIDRAIEEAALGLGRGPVAHVSSRHPSARHAGRDRRHDPVVHPGDERLCHARASRRPDVPDDGTDRLQPVRGTLQLAVRRRDGVRADDGNAAADRHVELACAGALPAANGGFNRHRQVARLIRGLIALEIRLCAGRQAGALRSAARIPDYPTNRAS